MTLALNLDLLPVARRYAADPNDWPFAPRFDPTRRWYARLAVTDDHEAWLLTWLPGQSTDLHDHGGSAGAFTILEGNLTEQTPSRGTVTERLYAAGATRTFGPHHVHRVVNAGTVPAVSLHVYTPALTTMTRYALVDGVLRVLSVEREGVSW